ncbi:GH92 family glycosyl hydrolase, partial [Gemmatimonadota bacterium]
MRRIGTGTALTLLVVLMISSGGCVVDREKSLTSLVDPFIGTGGHGHTYPGATLPFGMVQVSPDTRLEGWDGCSGYHYSDEYVYGFSHTHLSGTGIADYCDILLMPTVDEVRYDNGADGEPGYRSHFSHEREEASPGYYQTFLDDYDVGVELTATRRAAIHQYTFPETDQANVIIDLAHRDQVIESWITFVGEDEIEGYRRSRSWAQDQRVYFVARFSRPFEGSGVLVDGLQLDGVSQAYGTDLKASVSFSTDRDEAILVKVGISAVDIDGARQNLDAEIPAWDFDGVRADADLIWESELGRIVVEGGTREQRTVFYTALYHTMLAPNVYQDVDGRYRGRDFAIHQAEGFTNHTVFSLWDTFRAAHPLFALIQQERTTDFIETFLAQYEQGGLPPVWELSANETNTMIGYHSIPVIADAWMKGIRDFDIVRAFEAMTAAASTDREGLDHYRELGYIPGDEEGESVSRTLEYAYDDWCIAAIADEIDRPDAWREYTERARFYQNVFDPSTRFMRAKLDGHWQSDFDPREVSFHYTEANSWQFSFFAPHDVNGLIRLMGGPEQFIERLDGLFTADSETTGRQQSDITGLIGQYAHGNEPSHHMAYLYSYAGESTKTQERVREILDTLYSDAPDGLSGNEDCGQMSAWFVLSALGFYPVCPGQPDYVIGTPPSPRASIRIVVVSV